MKVIYLHRAAWVIGLFCMAGAQAQQPEARQDRLNKQERAAIAAPETSPTTEQGRAALPPGTAVPQLIRFSGMVKDQLGKPRTGVVGVSFSIYREQEGGAALWMETQNVELDEQGHYSVLLGGTKSEGLPLELFSSGETRWLGVQVNLPKELEQPRVLLVSVPYALKAADAETLGGKPFSAFVLATPPSEGGAGASKVPNAAATTAGAAATIGGGGTQNVVAKFDATGVNVINASISDNGSRINAGEGIDFSSDFSFVGNANPAATGRVQMFDRAFVGFVVRGLNVLFETLQGSPAVPTEVMRVTQAGNVGIGTSAPGQKLSVAGMIQSTTGGVMFPDGTVQTTAGGGGGGTVTSVTAGAGLSASPGNPITSSGTLSIATGGVTNAMLGTNSVTNANIADGSLSPAKITGIAATLGANTFTGNQSVAGSLSAITGSFSSGTNTLTSFTNSTAAGTGLFSVATAVTGTSSGVFGQSNSPNGTGLFGLASASAPGSAGNGVFGQTNSTNGTGVSGQATDTTGLDASGSPAGSDGVHGGSASPFGNGVSGFASCNPNTGCPADSSAASTSKGGTGVFGSSASPFGTGVFAFSTWPPNDCGTPTNPTCDPQSGGPVGMFATAKSVQGIGGFGFASSILAANNTATNPPGPPIPRGGPVGVIGLSRSPNGIGVFGVANWPPVGCGTTIPNCNPNITPIGVAGVYGAVRRTTGAGVYGESDTTLATAATFNNAAGSLNNPATTDCLNAGTPAGSGCNVLIAQANGTNVFRVSGDGHAHAIAFDPGGADFAESVAVRGERRLYDAGDVMVIDDAGNRSLAKAQKPYSTLVAGIVSTKPGVLASLHNSTTLAGQKAIEAEVPLAVVGIVPCKVSAENGPIHAGDLLVTSSTPGYAMKGTNRRRMLGAVVGKALEPLREGKGVIQVLVTLQ